MASKSQLKTNKFQATKREGKATNQGKRKLKREIIKLPESKLKMGAIQNNKLGT